MCCALGDKIPRHAPRPPETPQQHRRTQNLKAHSAAQHPVASSAFPQRVLRLSRIPLGQRPFWKIPPRIRDPAQDNFGHSWGKGVPKWELPATISPTHRPKRVKKTALTSHRFLIQRCPSIRLQIDQPEDCLKGGNATGANTTCGTQGVIRSVFLSGLHKLRESQAPRNPPWVC
ncbi:hypothetical protein LSM04_003370 [Trypanosoma melophagium]|uniref:uncharacterized protein n=1 Tax=Trypanosoma melophagium TaxID=715481 RepID=UPI003519EF87|nr:hypothetical protein LSM04_003370 [Trypanosoma melophagium]